MKYTKKLGLLIASAVAVFFTTQFLSAQIVGPPVFTPQMTVSPGFLTVTTGPTTVEDLTINGTCTGCPSGPTVPSADGEVLRSDGAGGIKVNGDATITADDLTVGGQIISTTGGFVAPNTGVAGAAYGFATDPDLGLSRGGADNLQLQANGGIFFRGIWPTGITIGGTGATQIPTTITGTATFNASAAFNGGTSGVSAPFTVDSDFLVTNLNADLLDGISSASFAQLANSNTFTGATQEFENATPIFQVDETDAASNERNWLYRSSAGILAISTATDAAPTTAVANAVTIDRTGTTVDSINLQATSVQKNGVEIATYETGSFTVNYGNACTTTPSQTWDYIKIGNQVTIKLDATSGFPCTGDTTSFSSGAVPAALIPPDNVISPMFGDGGCQDNGTVVQCAMSISGGLGLMAQADCSGGGACNATGWQATGNRAGFALGVTFTYSLDP